MDTTALHSLIAETEPNICQIVCLKNGQRVYADTRNGYRPADCVHVMSVTKSVVALLVGICLDRGLIGGLDDRVMDYFPDYTVKRGEKTIYEVTLEHLLTMKAPLKCKGDPWSRVCSSEDWTTASLDFLGGRGGLTGAFRYSTVCLHILTGVIARVSGMTTVDFANRYLFEPLGIAARAPFLAETAEEHKQFTVSKTPKPPVWFGDPRGVGAAGYGLCASAEELATLGALCLGNGLYEGKRIVSADWIDRMFTETHRCGEEFGGMGYGRLWWIIDGQAGIYAAIGNSGNVIYINRSTGFTAGVTAYFKPTVLDRVEFIRKHLDR